LTGEGLEDRALLTILFTPQNGVETASNGDSYRLGASTDLDLYTVYWGSYWGTTAGAALQAAYENSLNSLFDWGPTLDGISQYGVTNHAVVPSSSNGNIQVDDLESDPSNGFFPNEVTGVIDYAISGLGLANYADSSALYLVVTPPGVQSANSGEGGYHSYYYTGSGTRYYAWIGDTDGNGLDTLTDVTSHEVMEAMTDPV
jgi:hypothetical protein